MMAAKKSARRPAVAGATAGFGAAAAAAAVLALVALPASAAERTVPTFDAHYVVEYKGHKVGKMDMSVHYDEKRQRYRFVSRTQASGVLKVVRPKATVQTTDFVLHDGEIRPLEFWLDDGTRKGEDDRHIVFDWDHGTAIVTRDDRMSELPLEPDMLDGGTILVALMLDLERAVAPGPYKYTDGDAPSSYEYTPTGTEKLDVEAGTFEAAVIKQHHEGSSRHTVFWAVPKLRFLPAKIAQYKNDELLTAMTLDSVEGLEPKAAPH
ncbi:MAG TPA: DUF3108 domain-containing protein [Gammaproteobacteria bacterium]|nr:DUF3108 domain-containing protein [Gammaproteobacteria bacterium]